MLSINKGLMATVISNISKTQGGLFQYINEVNKIPILSIEEEIKYAKLKETGNLNAIKMLVSSHLKLVVKIAFKYKNYKLPISDLISEGNIGLMKAVKGFDLSKGCRFATYATWWIRAYMQDYILKSWSLVKIGTTVAQKKLFFSLRKIKNKILKHNQKNLTNQNIREIAKECDVRVQDVIEMDKRLSVVDASLNISVPNSEDKVEALDLIESTDASQDVVIDQKREKNRQQQIMQLALSKLNERERDIIFNRKLQEKPIKLDDLAKKYGISKERVRQIEKKSLEKLKDFIQKNYK